MTILKGVLAGLFFTSMLAAKNRLEDLENTDWERPVKTYKCNTTGCNGIAPNRNRLCNKCVQNSGEQGFEGREFFR